MRFHHLAVAAIIIGATIPAPQEAQAAAECASRPHQAADSGYWRYRIISGRRCWYKGDRDQRLTRSRLRRHARLAAAPQPAATPITLAPTPAEPDLSALADTLPAYAARIAAAATPPIETDPDPCAEPLMCSYWPPLEAPQPAQHRLLWIIVLAPIALGIAAAIEMFGRHGFQRGPAFR